MSVLWRKTLRDLWRSKLLFGAIILLLATGVGLFISMYSAFQDLSASESYSYDQLKFADAQFSLANGSGDAVTAASQVTGVVAAEGRTVTDIAIKNPEAPTVSLPARIITIPETGRPTVNDLYVNDGSFVPDGASQSVMIDKGFADSYGLKPGDTVDLTLGGSTDTFEIAAAVTSPEYIWKAKSNQEPFVGKGDFAVIFARESAVSDLLGDNGTINEVVARFDSTADPEATITSLSAALSDYGVTQVVPRDEQVSYLLLKLDLDGFAELAVMVPAMFLVITALIVYVLLNRTVQSQRLVVGLMRAVGFGRIQVIFHYLSFTVLLAAGGVTLGIAGGLLLGRYLVTIYAAGVGIPYTTTEFHPWPLVISVALGFAVSLAGGAIPSWIAARRSPAEAMRSSAPAVRSVSFLDNLIGLRRAPYVIRLAVRNSLRTIGRTSSSVLGVGVAVGLVVASLGMLDSMSHAFTVQFDEIQRYDLKVQFSQPVSTDAVMAYADTQGIAEVEPLNEAPVTISHGNESQITALTGLQEGSSLMRLQRSGGADPLSTSGLYISQGVSSTLNAGVGDSVSLQMGTNTVDVTVDGLVKQPLSGGIYMRESAVAALFGGSSATGALVSVSQGADIQSVTEALFQDPQVLTVEDTEKVRTSFQSLMALFYQFVAVFILFGVSLGAVAIFNTVTINIMDRRQELATMRALGFSRMAVDTLLTVENLIIGSAGALIGFVIGYIMELELIGLFQAGSFTIDAYIAPLSYLIVGIAALIIVVASEIPSVRSLHRIDLAAATKGTAS